MGLHLPSHAFAKKYSFALHGSSRFVFRFSFAKCVIRLNVVLSPVSYADAHHSPGATRQRTNFITCRKLGASSRLAHLAGFVALKRTCRNKVPVSEEEIVGLFIWNVSYSISHRRAMTLPRERDMKFTGKFNQALAWIISAR